VQEQGERLLSDDAADRGFLPVGHRRLDRCAIKIWQDQAYRDHEEAGLWVSDMAAGRRMGSRTAFLWVHGAIW